jgi:hypothetical protein
MIDAIADLNSAYRRLRQEHDIVDVKVYLGDSNNYSSEEILRAVVSVLNQYPFESSRA